MFFRTDSEKLHRPSFPRPRRTVLLRSVCCNKTVRACARACCYYVRRSYLQRSCRGRVRHVTRKVGEKQNKSWCVYFTFLLCEPPGTIHCTPTCIWYILPKRCCRLAPRIDGTAAHTHTRLIESSSLLLYATCRERWFNCRNLLYIYKQHGFVSNISIGSLSRRERPSKETEVETQRKKNALSTI